MLLSKHAGNIQKNGRTSGQIRNNYEIWEDSYGKYIKMEILKKGELFYTYFDHEDLDKVLSGSKTWYLQTNGYVSRTRPFIYLHHLVSDFRGSGKGFGNLSIDHIDRDPLNNRKHNLRLATCDEQKKNSKGQIEGTKRNRKNGSKELPEGINHNDLPKYVVYYSEYYGPNKNFRDFFRIEKHPAQLTKEPILKDKWATSKSMKFTARQKLDQAIEKLKELDSM